MAALTPELQAALAAQVQYYRDLGIFDFYRQNVTDATLQLDAAVSLVAEAGPVGEMRTSTSPTAAQRFPVPSSVSGLTLSSVSAPAPSSVSHKEAPEIAARRSTPVLPLIPEPSYAHLAGKGSAALVEIREELGDCTRCKLSTTRNKIVFGDGDPKARLLFVGEGPGADEDAQGLPFVGRGGQLLNNMINAMGLKREQVYIANIVKCRPPSNRVPEPDEAHTCLPFLEQQIAAVQPEVIVALGSTAATYLLGVKSSLGALRGKIHASRGAKLIVTYHPAFLLRDPRQKKEAWADLKMAMAELGLRPPSKPQAE